MSSTGQQMCSDSDFDKLAVIAEAATDEMVMAVMFHETWKPAALDERLHARMGTSFATQSFNIVRIALRREMVMAMMRIWDTNPESVRMSLIAETLKNKAFVRQLMARRASRLGKTAESIGHLLNDSLETQRRQVLNLIRKYQHGGTGYDALERIRLLRHERLAHRQALDSPTRIDPSDTEVDALYEDSLTLVTLLQSLILGRAFDLDEAGNVYRHHASFFWASVRGEQTEGHPNYRPPPDSSAA